MKRWCRGMFSFQFQRGFNVRAISGKWSDHHRRRVALMNNAHRRFSSRLMYRIFKQTSACSYMSLFTLFREQSTVYKKLIMMRWSYRNMMRSSLETLWKLLSFAWCASPIILFVITSPCLIMQTFSFRWLSRRRFCLINNNHVKSMHFAFCYSMLFASFEALDKRDV